MEASIRNIGKGRNYNCKSKINTRLVVTSPLLKCRSLGLIWSQEEKGRGGEFNNYNASDLLNWFAVVSWNVTIGRMVKCRRQWDTNRTVHKDEQTAVRVNGSFPIEAAVGDIYFMISIAMTLTYLYSTVSIDGRVNQDILRGNKTPNSFSTMQFRCS